MNFKYIITIIIISCALAAMPASIAQGQAMATASGHIYNESNSQPVSGANIVATSMDTSQVYSDVTDGSGYYSINLPPGNYRVTVDAGGFEHWEETNFLMGIDPAYNDIYLSPEGGGSGGDDYDDGDDDGSDSPFGDLDEDMLETMVKVLVALVVIFFICLITMTVALVMMSVRLGKIRKELKAMNETLDEMVPEETSVPQSQVVFRQPPEPPTQ